MTTPELRARWRQRIEDLTYSDGEVAEWCVELMDEVDALGRGGDGWASYAAEQERHAHLEERLADMTREARLSRESTEKAVQRLENLRNEIARLHDVYAVAPNEPRCCSDCAALDISDELRMTLRNA